MKRLAWVVLGFGFVAIAARLGAIPPQRMAVEAVELSYFPSGKLVKTAAMGFDGLAADVAFLQMVQYYGKHRRLDRSYPWAPHMIEIVTTLDPRFVTPYVFGALVLAEDMRRLDLAVELLERGMAQAPDRWELPFEAGFLLFVHDRGNARAGVFLERAARIPGAPAYVHRFAADAYRRGGSAADALRLWREIAETTTEPGLRETARRYVEQLEATPPR
jgi:hypothetical protein